MKIDLLFSPLEAQRCITEEKQHRIDLTNTTSVVVDVLRACSTMIYAFNGFDNEEINSLKGVKEIIPAKNIESARELFNISNSGYLLAGEREGYPPEGFHFGNSPFDFTLDKAADKSLIMATTNGTRTLNLLKSSKNLLIGSFINAKAVAKRCVELESDVLIGCAGRWGVSGLEDITCGGIIANYIQQYCNEKEIKVKLSDSIKLAMKSYDSYDSIRDILEDSAHGKYLYKKGLEKDLIPCSFLNKFNIVPYYKDGKLIAGIIEL